MLVGLAISTMVIGLITTAVVQFFQVTRAGHAQLLVGNGLESASLWLGRDANEASSFTAGSGTVYGTLSWADDSIQYRYSYDAAQKALVREVIQNSVVQSTQIVTRGIEAQSDVAFSGAGSLLTVLVTVTRDGRTGSATLQLAMRVNG